MIVLATSNINKIKEYNKIYPYFEYKISDIKVDIDENGNSFKENAFIKASAYYNLLNENILSDDSGLEIEALNNFPSIYSSRWANNLTQEEKNKLILEKLKNINNRKARFVCVICLIDKNGNKYYGEGIVNGTISKIIKGENGFGYDPIFIPDGYDKTFGELDESIKNKISHRANAINDLINNLPLKFKRREIND